MRDWNKMSQKGLRFALKLSPDTELVARRWYRHLLHNKRAALLKALLLVRGDDDIVVINVPWYLNA